MMYPALEAIQYKEELDVMGRYAKANGCKTMLEIGVALCGTSWAMYEVMGKDSYIVGVDLPEHEGGTPKLAENEAKRRMGEHFTLVRGRSTAPDTLDGVLAALKGREVDLLFIDANHTEKDAMDEYRMYRALLSKKCIVGFHDITMRELWPMWNRLRAERDIDRTIEIIRDRTHGGCGIGLILGRE